MIEGEEEEEWHQALSFAWKCQHLSLSCTYKTHSSDLWIGSLKRIQVHRPWLALHTRDRTYCNTTRNEHYLILPSDLIRFSTVQVLSNSKIVHDIREFVAMPHSSKSFPPGQTTFCPWGQRSNDDTK